ncbi:MAG: transposase, partial [Nitrososphaera sp.]|nr:transposase [Nitrososphaera sp.]
MTAILGIDVSKATLDVCLVLEGTKHKARFKNSSVGFEELLVWLRMRTSQNIHVCMEATGRYSDAVAAYLFDHEFIVSVVNARLIKNHAGSQLLRSKTDKLDAAVIADYCLKNQPPAWSPKSEAILELQEINGQMDATTKMIADQTNRLKSLINSAQVIASIEADIEHQRCRLKK